MSEVTSAAPDDLAEFTSAGKPMRTSAESFIDEVAGVQRSVRAGSPSYDVSSDALPRASQLVSGMEDNERYVDAVRAALLTADHLDGDVVTLPDASVDAFIEAAWADRPPPPVLTVEPAYLLGDPPTSGFVDDPICAANGNFFHVETDLAFPARTAVLDVVRSYNSLGTEWAGAFGPGWSSVLDLRLEPVDDDRVRVRLADGAVVSFTAGSDGTLRAVGPRPLHVTVTGPEGWTLHEGHTKRWRFDADGHFAGGTCGAASLTVSRDGRGRVVAITEERSGRWVRYEWAHDRVRRTVASDGRTCAYRYDDQGVLVGVDRRDDATTYEVDGALIVSVTDADGVRTARNVYDPDGRVVEQTNELGRTTRYRYSDQGTTLVSDTAEGPRNAFVHDRAGNLTALVDGHGRAMRLSYDDHGRVTGVVDRAGAVTSHAFDGDGNLVARTDPDGLGQRWTWDDRGRLVTETHRDDSTTTYEYFDDHRQPVRITTADGASITVELNDAGDPARLTDADGVTTSYEWDADGQITAIVDGLGNRSTLSYDSAGLPTQIVDRSGSSTELVNDAAGRLIRTVTPTGSASYTYTAAGRLTSATDPSGVGWTAEHGPHGRVQRFVDGEGSTLGFEWDPFGNLDTLVAPDGARFGHRYDASGSLVALVDPAGSTTRYEHDAEGRVVEVVDAEQRSLRREVDVLGRTVRSIAPDGAVTAYEYHPDGEVARVVHPDGASVSTELDAVGRVAAIVDETGARYEMTYTPGGRLRTRTWPSGRAERFHYDAAGRLVRTEERSADGRTVSTTAVELDAAGRARRVDGPDGWQAYTYTDGGALAEVRSATSTTRFEHDAAGRVTAVVDGTGVRQSFGHDRRGLLRSATDPAGLTARFDLDERGRLSDIVEATGGVTRYGYDHVGWPTSVVDPTGGMVQQRFDRAGCLTSRTTADGDELRHALDAAGRILRVSCGDDDLATFAYDERGRLTRAQRGDAASAVELWRDPAGRITEMLSPSGPLAVDRDQDGVLTGWRAGSDEVTVQRDERGEITALHDAALGAARSDAAEPSGLVRDLAGRITVDGGGTTHRYDDAGRLVESVDRHGVRHAWGYDERGHLASESGPAGVTRYERGFLGRVEAVHWADGARTQYAYDASGHRVEERHSSGATRRYQWNALGELTAIDQQDGDTVEIVDVVHDGLGRPVRIGGVEVRWDDPLCALPSGVGDERAMHVGARTYVSSDATWALLPSATTAWGDADADAAHVGLRGHVAAEGLVWMGARVYDPRTREFLSPDPLPAVPGRPGHDSTYAYGFADPVNHLDPTGQRPVSIEQYLALRKREEAGRLGQAWDAIKHDPWGSLMMGLTTAAGVGLLCFPGTQGAGVMILAGEATSGAFGLASGNFNPRTVAANGVAGGLTAGTANVLGPAATTTSGFAFLGGVNSATAYSADHVLNDRPISATGLLEQTALGTGTGYALGGIANLPSSPNPYPMVDGLEHVTSTGPRVRVQGATGTASSAIDARDLGRQLASEQQIGEAGTVIAGPGARKSLLDAQRLADQYGGLPGDWGKVASSTYRGQDGFTFETHWYENLVTQKRVEFKTKLPDGSVVGYGP